MNNANRLLKLNGKPIDSLEKLKENFNAEELTSSYKDGSLIRWLDFFFYDKISAQVKNIDPNENIGEQLAKIFKEPHETSDTFPKGTILDYKKNVENLEDRNDIFKSAEELLQEADNFYNQKNYRETLSRCMDAYCLSNEEAVEHLQKVINESYSEEKNFKLRKFFSIIIAILITTTIIFSLGYFKTQNEFKNLKSNEQYINRKLDDLNEEKKFAQRERDKLKKENQNLKQELEKTKKELSDALKRLKNSTSSVNVNRTNSNVHLNTTNIQYQH